MATVSEGKRLDMLGKRQKMELARTGSFTTRTGDQYTPNYIDLAATASKGGKDLQSLSVFMSENPDYSPQTSPSVIDATTVGTPAPAVEPVNPTSSISDQLAKIESQALALKDTIDQRVADEKALTEGTPAPAEGTQPPALGGTEAPPSSQRDQLLSSYIEQALGGFQLSDEAQQLQTEAAQANKLAKDLQNDMIAYAKQTRETIMEMRTNPEGKSMGAMQAGIQNYEYERYNGKDGMADMAIAAQYALNNAEYAYEIANNAVSAEREQYNSQMTAMKNIYDMLQNDMTTSEQLQYQSQLRMYENQVENFTDAKQTALQNAASNGAPEDVLLAIKNATTTDDVWYAAGQYGEDPSIGINREQLAISRGNLALAYDKFRWDKEYAITKLGLDQALAAGEMELANYNKLVQTNATRKEIGKSIDAIARIQANTIGLGATTGKVTGRTAGFFDLGTKTGGVGAVGGAPFGPVGVGIGGVAGFLTGGFFGASEAREQQENIANDMDYIEAALTTQRIGYAKSMGLTGAMSDKDIELIGSSADELVAAWDKENMVFRGSPEQIDFYLNQLSTTLAENQEILLYDPEYMTAVLGDANAAIDEQF